MKSTIYFNQKEETDDYPCLKYIDEDVYGEKGCFVVLLMRSYTAGTVVHCSDHWRDRFGYDVGYYCELWNGASMKRYENNIVLGNS